MRPAVVLVILVLSAKPAASCPQQDPDLPAEGATNEMPATTSPCLTNVDWNQMRRLLEVRYTLGVGGTTRSGIGSGGTAFAGLDLAYALQFGSDPAQPSYELELSGGVAAHRHAGAIDANALTTRAALRLGPARVAESIVDDGIANLAAFPMTLELAHAGELAARPRIGARPELARSLYSRERVELATRILRVEGAGVKASTAAPGETEPQQPSSWALDLLPLHAGVDVAFQEVTRFETAVGGALLGVVEHSLGVKLDLLGVEHQRIDLSPMGPTSMNTVWMLRLDAVDPTTGTAYMAGWGELILPEELIALGYQVDAENGTPSVGGVGWYTRRSWGGFGLQYKRDAYLSMAGEIGLEDRISGELYVPRLLDVVLRGFGARTMRLVDDALVHDFTAGVELGASYQAAGWSAKVGLELGRTFYTALDDMMPTTTGFVGSLGVTMQHSGGRAWRR